MLQATVKENLCAIVDAYMSATGLSEAQISKRFYGNVQFFREFRIGKHSISVKKLDEIVAEFKERWPPDAEWPYLRPLLMGRVAK
jgi:hypothetical protein